MAQHQANHYNPHSSSSVPHNYSSAGGNPDYRPESADYSNGQSNGQSTTAAMNYAQYPASYVPPAYGHSAQQQQQQHPPQSQQHAHHHHHHHVQQQHPVQHPVQQYGQLTQQPVRSSLSSYLDQRSANQLPPMAVPRDDPGVAGLGPVGNPMNPPPFTASAMSMQAQPQTLAPPQQQIRPQTSAIHEDKPTSFEYNGYKWTLKIVQQPQRARMCGFGDKDRRPITPPPVAQLIVTDPKTGRVVPPKELEDLVDYSHFAVSVDLYSENKSHEAILVRANSNSPSSSISSASTTAYPPTEQPQRQSHMMVLHHGQYGYPMQPAYAMPIQDAYGQTQYVSTAPGMYGAMSGANPYASPYAHNTSASNYSRNLIGSLTVNAAKLKDEKQEEGYFFVFQDLSVRMEGKFRARMSFVNLSLSVDGSPPQLNRKSMPILCWVYTDIFQVYSAKKFPGVIESTPLSKCFASQGIKIPIRKDNGGKNDGATADGADDDEGD